MKFARALGIAALAWTGLTSCQLGYIARQGMGQLGVLWSSRPIEDVLEDPQFPESSKGKLRLIRRIVEYGEREIGLRAHENYTTFLDLEGKPISYQLFACPKTSLRPMTWNFPIVGEFSYIGYFDLDDAKAARKELEEAGYDVHLGTVAAYSTSGWFQDPILSSMLDDDEIDLARLLFHEMVHGTVFRPGETQFNESFAEFVAEKATARYLDWRFGLESPQRAEFLARLADDRLFESWVRGLKDGLEALYGSSLSEEDKLAEREQVFDAAKMRLRSSDESGRFARFLETKLNNALLLALVTYNSESELFEREYWHAGGNLRLFLLRISELRAEAEAFEQLRASKP